MNSVMNIIRPLLSVGMAVLLTGGCSIIGYSIGSAVDSRKADYKLISGCSYMQVRPGKVVTILSRDGSELRGAFLGVSVASDSSYKEMLNSAEVAASFDLPALGEKVYLRFRSGTADEAEFRGFDYISPSLVLSPAVLLKFPDRDSVIAVGASSLHELCTLGGKTLSAEDLITGIAQGTIPSRSILEIDTGAVKTLRISPESLCSDTTLYQQLCKSMPRLLGIVTKSDSLVSCTNRLTHWNVAAEKICFTSDQGRHFCEVIESLKFIDVELPGDSTLLGDISLSQVAAIRVIQSRHAATTGFVVGLGLDVAVLIIGIAGAGTMDMYMNFGG